MQTKQIKGKHFLLFFFFLFLPTFKYIQGKHFLSPFLIISFLFLHLQPNTVLMKEVLFRGKKTLYIKPTIDWPFVFSDKMDGFFLGAKCIIGPTIGLILYDGSDNSFNCLHIKNYGTKK